MGWGGWGSGLVLILISNTFRPPLHYLVEQYINILRGKICSGNKMLYSMYIKRPTNHALCLAKVI